MVVLFMQEQHTDALLKPQLAKAREELALSQERLELVLEVSELSLWDWDLSTQEVFHTRSNEVLGLTTENGEALLRDLRLLAHPQDLPMLRQAMISHLKGETQEYFAEFRMRHGDGHWIWIEDRGRIVERNASGRALRMIGTRRDITMRKQQDAALHAAHSNSKKIKYLSEYDSLTGLANREMFHHRLSEAVQKCSGKNGRFALLHLDLDRFKVLNETLGVEVADQLLSMFSRRLSETFAQANTLARLSGDEFAIILRHYGSYASLKRLAELVLERISQPIELAGKSLVVTASIGVSLMPEHAQESGELMNQAAVALKQAKYHGGNSVEFYNERMQVSAMERLELEQQLRHAINNGELCAFYQPKVDLVKQKICSVEALARWNHPVLGMISPAQFIPIAEEVGLIKVITEQVLEQACEQARLWSEQGYEIAVSVNLSVHHVRQGNILQLVKDTLQKTGLQPHLLELELTENHFLDSEENILEEFVGLRKLGVRLAIDDFGTGFSSLGYLKIFPADTIKIDQSFIRDVASGQADAKITSAIIAMAHSLGLKVVAEGIETREQLDFLVRSDCDEVQGFFISRPVPAMQMQQLLGEFCYSNLIA